MSFSTFSLAQGRRQNLLTYSVKYLISCTGFSTNIHGYQREKNSEDHQSRKSSSNDFGDPQTLPLALIGLKSKLVQFLTNDSYDQRSAKLKTFPSVSAV